MFERKFYLFGLIVLLFVFCTFFNSCYAMTTTELEYYIEDFNSKIGNNNTYWNNFYVHKNDFINNIQILFNNNNLDIENLTNFVIQQPPNSNAYFQFRFGEDYFFKYTQSNPSSLSTYLINGGTQSGTYQCTGYNPSNLSYTTYARNSYEFL